jgi:hypothetical protein
MLIISELLQYYEIANKYKGVSIDYGATNTTSQEE